MKEFLTSEITKQTSRIALLIFIILASILYVYRTFTYTYINVEFTDARPVRNKIPVYFKGYRIGKVEKIKLSPDFKSTMVTIVLYPPNIKLPSNMTALLTKEEHERTEYDFINLIYPEHPGSTILKDGDSIAGFTTVDLETFLSKKALSGELDEIKDNVNNLLTSLTGTSEALMMFFGILQDTVNENRPAIKTTTSNLAATSNNLKMFSSKLNNSIDERNIQNTLLNVNTTSSSAVITSRNLEVITNNIDKITNGVNKSMPEISTSITNAENIAQNLNEITTGVSKTLKQNFGGLRILFGKTIKTNCN